MSRCHNGRRCNGRRLGYLLRRLRERRGNERRRRYPRDRTRRGSERLDPGFRNGGDVSADLRDVDGRMAHADDPHVGVRGDGDVMDDFHATVIVRHRVETEGRGRDHVLRGAHAFFECSSIDPQHRERRAFAFRIFLRHLKELGARLCRREERLGAEHLDVVRATKRRQADAHADKNDEEISHNLTLLGASANRPARNAGACDMR